MTDPGHEDRFGTAACARCGAREVISDARVIPSGAGETYVSVFGRPRAMLFKKRKHSKVRARACTACGHLDLYATDPDALREAFDEADDRA